VFVPRTSSTTVVLANGRWKCGACYFVGLTERVHLVGLSISFEKNFYRLPFTPPLSGRLIVPSNIASMDSPGR
jgi:hypothetical protein